MPISFPGRLSAALPIFASLLVTAVATASPGQSPDRSLSSASLELSDVVSAALERNPSISVAEHRRAGAAARPAGLRSLPDPTARVGLYAQPLDSLDPLDGQLRLQLAQQFPHPGTLDRRAEVAEQEVDRLAADISASRAAVAAAARHAFHDLHLAERAREIHHGHLQLVRELSESTEERYAAGESPQENVLRALQELTSLFTELAAVDRDLATARVALNRVLHRAPTAAIGSPRPPSRSDLDGRDLGGLLAAAEVLSPELLAARAAIRRESARVESERHEAKPDYGVMIEWWTASDGMGGRFERYAVLGTLTLPWAHDGKYEAAVDRAMAARAAEEAHASGLRDRVFADVADAWERARAAGRIAELYRTTLLPQSEQSLEAARTAYQTGMADFVTVVDNERTLLMNRLALARIEAEYGHAIADLLQAVGVTGWEQIPRDPAGPPTREPAGPGGSRPGSSGSEHE